MNNDLSSKNSPLENNALEDEVLDERYLERLSALADGELDQEWLLPTIDFLVRTPEAQAFYMEARSLDGVLEGAGLAEPTPRLDPSLWNEIERQLAASDPSQAAEVDQLASHRDAREYLEGGPSSGSKWARPMWALAAALFTAVLGIASFELWQERTAVDSRPDQVANVETEVTVGGRPDAMNDQRFIVLATEMLEADRRYRKEMLALMEAVEEQPLIEKSTSETFSDDIEETPRFGESSNEDERGGRRGVDVNFW